MADAHKSMRCWHSIRHIPERAYRRATDGRKAGAVCAKRRTLVQELSGYADPDGTNITVSVETLSDRIGWARRTVLYLLDDLEDMGLLLNGRLTKWNGTRIRALNLPAILGLVAVQNSKGVEVQDSILVEVQNSGVEVQNGFHSSAKQPFTSPATPPILHTTVTPTESQPPKPPSAIAAMAGREGFVQTPAAITEWQKQLPAPMNTATMGRHKSAVVAMLKEKGAALTAGCVKAFVDVADLGGLRDPWWKFVNEVELHWPRAFEYTPEGRAAKVHSENDAVENAAAFMREIALNQEQQAEACDEIRKKYPWMEEPEVHSTAAKQFPELFEKK